MARSTVRLTLHRLQGQQRSRRKDRIAVEAPLAMRLSWGQQPPVPINVTMRTPGHDFELAAGFLYAEGVLRQHKDLQHITHCLDETSEEQHYNVVRITLAEGVPFAPGTLERHFTTTSSCGVCGKASIESLQQVGHPPLPPESPRLSPATLFQLEHTLQQAQVVFAQTGGLHAAALFAPDGTLLSLREDVGRHNALDKLIGQQFLADTLPLSECMVVVSGRVSFELVQKTLRAGIPILIAVGAPSSLAIELAEGAGMTLIGFAREGRCNVYTGIQRITEDIPDKPNPQDETHTGSQSQGPKTVKMAK